MVSSKGKRSQLDSNRRSPGTNHRGFGPLDVKRATSLASDLTVAEFVLNFLEKLCAKLDGLAREIDDETFRDGDSIKRFFIRTYQILDIFACGAEAIFRLAQSQELKEVVGKIRNNFLTLQRNFRHTFRHLEQSTSERDGRFFSTRETVSELLLQPTRGKNADHLLNRAARTARAGESTFGDLCLLVINLRREFEKELASFLPDRLAPTEPVKPRRTR